MKGKIRIVLDDAFPERHAVAVEQVIDSGHPGNQTVRVRFASNGVAYLKIRIDGDAERNAREAGTIQYARDHCPIRVPTVLAVDSGFDPPYLATAPIGGTAVTERWKGATFDERTLLAREIGRAVAGISHAQFTEPGWIVGGDENDLNCKTGRWSVVLADAIERRADEVSWPDRFDDVPQRVVTLITQQDAILDDPPATLLHADVRATNVFLNETPGVIDWEWTLVGDPGLMLCWAEERTIEQAAVPDGHRETLRTALRTGYRRTAGTLPAGFERRLPLYRVVAFLTKLQTFHLWAPDAPEPTGDLATWVVDELDTRIEAANAIQ